MQNYQALANLRGMIQSFSPLEIQPGSKPEQFISNWSCTSLYKKSTCRGRVWQFIHWLRGTSESSLRKTITETARIANLTIQTELNKQNEMVKKINDPGVLGSFWTNHSVSQMQASLRDAVRYRTLLNTVQWAQGNIRNIGIQDSEEKNVEMAIKKINTAIKLENIWKKFASDISITTLYRELQSLYPSTQEELKKHRDYLQQTTLGKYPKQTAWHGEKPVYGKETKCPEELLYSPLVAMARQLAKHELPKDILTKLFHDLMEKSSLPTGQILLDLAIFLKNPAVMPVPSQLPSSVAKAVMNSNWVRKCNLDVTIDESNILGCRPEWIKRERVFECPVNAYDHLNGVSWMEYTIRSEEYMQKIHVRSYYCYEKKIDGTESIQVHESVQEIS